MVQKTQPSPFWRVVLSRLSPGSEFSHSLGRVQPASGQADRNAVDPFATSRSLMGWPQSSPSGVFSQIDDSRTSTWVLNQPSIYAMQASGCIAPNKFFFCPGGMFEIRSHHFIEQIECDAPNENVHAFRSAISPGESVH
jgi:hypothetical protein